jgi:hypothetical protein
MSARRPIVLLIAVGGLCACGGSTTSPSSTPTNNGATISFSGLGGMPCVGFAMPSAGNCAVSSYTENGFAVTVNSANWNARIDYGSPPPFMQFWAAPGTSVTGEVVIAAPDGSPFYFRSVDLYSSTTPIPYTIRGSRRNTVFTETDTVPNTFGNFRTVVSQHSADAIDRLSIALTNAAAACCNNPMGVDSVVLSSSPVTPPAPTTFSLGGQVTDSATAAGIPGALVSIVDGPNAHLVATTDSSGNYRFGNLQQSGFTVTASVANYATQSKSVTLTSNQTVSFPLVHLPPLPPPPAGTTIIGFVGLSANGAPVTSYTESGFSVVPITAAWTAVTTRIVNGYLAPYIQFSVPSGSTVTGELRVSAADGSVFGFKAVDLYSSITVIPYKITGLRKSAPVFTVSDTLPNTFGNFRTVANPNSAAVIDTLSIALTNTAPTCCSNPMGLTNIVLTR